MRCLIHTVSARLLFGLIACAALTSIAPAEPAKPVDFAHDIEPILKARCAKCHTNGTRKGSFSMDTRADILKTKSAIPGKSADSEIVKRITSADKDVRMPPGKDPLSPREVALMKAWIDEGLSWQEGFSFKVAAYVPPLKPRRPDLPPAQAGRDHPIDRIVYAYFAKHKVQPPNYLDEPAFVRRIYLDLIGVLPSPSEVDTFRADASADKRQRLIHQLLNDKRSYSDHWLSFWNDMLRNDYAGTGYIDGGRKQITGWLYGAIQQNKPYDQFVRELISPTPDSDGFSKGIRWRGAVNASQVPELQFAQNVSQVFFGINMKCASCHDSFIDTWKLDDAYGMAAIIADAPLEIYRCDKATGRKASARFVFPELGTLDATQPKAKRLEQLAKLVTHPDNGRFPRTIANRIWQRLLGHGVVHPVDVMANRPWSDDLLDYLGVYLVDQKYDLKKLIEHIVTSRAYQSQPVPIGNEVSGEDYVFRGPEVRRMTAEQYIDALWLLTKTAPGAAVAPVTLPPFSNEVPAERRFVRAALVHADPLMRSLGRPNREQVVTTRPDQLTTLEALDLSNGKDLADLLARGASNLLKDKPKTPPDRRIGELYRRALGRSPTEKELVTARAILGTPATAEGLADLLWAIVMLPEFQLLR